MVYMGSKSKYAKYIVPILQKAIDENNITTYVEPFVGGANIIDKIKCKNKIGYDNNERLIALLCAARDGKFDDIPTFISREQWDEAKAYVKDGVPLKTMSLIDVGAAEFFASMSGGGFPRGYVITTRANGKTSYEERLQNLMAQVPSLRGIDFKVESYVNLSFNNCLIYCDPPYAGTKKYGYANFEKMDYNFFWNWIREMSKNNIVFVSEQTAPDDFISVWEKEVKRTNCTNNNFTAIEKLFIKKS